MCDAGCMVSGIAGRTLPRFPLTSLPWDVDLLEGGHIQQQNWSYGPDFHMTISLNMRGLEEWMFPSSNTKNSPKSPVFEPQVRGVCFSWHTGLRIFSGTYGHCLANKKANTPWKTWAGVPFLLNNSVKMVVTWNINNDTENGGIFRMVPLIINPIYTLYSGYLFGIYPTRITQWFLQIPSKTPEIFQFCHRDFDLGIRPKPTGRFKYLSRLWKGTLFSSMVVSVSGSHKRWDVAYNPPEGNI